MDNNPNREYSLPHMGNMSYDKEFQQNTVEIVGYNPKGAGSLERITTGALDFVVDDSNATYLYVGEAGAGAGLGELKWRIQRITQAVPYIGRYADGSTEFDKEWDERATYSY